MSSLLLALYVLPLFGALLGLVIFGMTGDRMKMLAATVPGVNVVLVFDIVLNEMVKTYAGTTVTTLRKPSAEAPVARSVRVFRSHAAIELTLEAGRFLVLCVDTEDEDGTTRGAERLTAELTNEIKRAAFRDPSAAREFRGNVRRLTGECIRALRYTLLKRDAGMFAKSTFVIGVLSGYTIVLFWIVLESLA